MGSECLPIHVSGLANGSLGKFSMFISDPVQVLSNVTQWLVKCHVPYYL